MRGAATAATLACACGSSMARFMSTTAFLRRNVNLLISVLAKRDGNLYLIKQRGSIMRSRYEIVSPDFPCRSHHYRSWDIHDTLHRLSGHTDKPL
jgi:hypothetical protein